MFNAAPPSGKASFVATVPGAEAPIYDLDLPEKLAGSARLRVARQLLSDKLGVPAEALDLTPIATAGSKSWSSVICTLAQSRQDWCGTSTSKNNRARAVLPEYMTLPAADKCLVATGDDNLVHVRLGLSDGFSVPKTFASDTLKAALEKHSLTQSSLSGNLPADFLETVSLAGLSNARDAQFSSAFTGSDLALDLRRAATANNGETVKLLRTWCMAAALSLSAFATWAASVALETNRIEQQSIEMRRAIVGLLREGLLPEGPILDIRQQVSQRMDNLNSSDDMSDVWTLDRLSLLSVALFGKGANVLSVSYQPSGGHSAIVQTRDFATAEALLDDLREAGFRSVDTSVREQDNGKVELRFRIPPDIEDSGR